LSAATPEVLAVWFQQGLTAKGTTLLTFEEMVALAEFSAQAETMVHTVEGYVLKGAAEICAPEYSLYGPEEKASALPWPDQVDHALRDVHALAVTSDRDHVAVKFQVWLASA